MPTPSEQKALAFLALVILLGGATRVVRAGPVPPPSPQQEAALAAQAGAVETAAVLARSRKKPVKKLKLARSRRDGGVDTVAGIASVPFSDVRPGPLAFGAVPASGRDGWVNGYPPPSPRIDIDNRQSPGMAVARGGLGARTADRAGGAGRPDTTVIVDLDHATAAEIDRLPRMGPAMAARLVANRDSFGPFRSLEGLRRVKGMGPATLRLLAPRVTFSGRPASFTAGRRDE